MSAQNRQVENNLMENPKFNKHLIMGYVFLALVFMGSVSSVYYWEHKVKVRAEQNGHNIGTVESGEQSLDANLPCSAEPVKAKQKITGEVREFENSCVVNSEWWEIQIK